MSYAAKCWRENTEVLRAANYICYSPSYGQADEDAKVEHNITSIYLNSSMSKVITPPGQDTNEKMITAILLHFMMKIKLMTAILLQFMMSALWY